MATRRQARRRRLSTDPNALTPEQVEVFITGDMEYGPLIATQPDRNAPPFKDVEHARAVWKIHRRTVLDIYRNGWKPEHGRGTLWVQNSPWLRDGTWCWAEVEFDGVERAAPELEAEVDDGENLIPAQRERL